MASHRDPASPLVASWRRLRWGLVIPVVVLVALVGVVAAIVAGSHPEPGGRPTPTVTRRPTTPVTSRTTPAPSRTTSAGPRVAVRSAAVGTCFTEQTAADSQYQYIRPLDCAVTHDSEIYLNSAMEAGEYPADDAWAGYFTQFCVPAFADYVGLGWDASRLDTHYIHPSPKAWANGDRMLTCYVVDPAGALMSSVKGIAQ